MIDRTPQRASLVVAFAAALLLQGCAWLKWVGNGGEGPASEVYYSGAAFLPVHEEATVNSPVVGHLELHERVTRTQVVSGYAHVIATKSTVEGWVNNAQLIWRLPPEAESAPAIEPAPAAQPAPAADPAPALDPVPLPVEVEATSPTPPEPAPLPVPDPPVETPEKPVPSVYDPF